MDWGKKKDREKELGDECMTNAHPFLIAFVLRDGCWVLNSRAHISTTSR